MYIIFKDDNILYKSDDISDSIKYYRSIIKTSDGIAICVDIVGYYVKYSTFLLDTNMFTKSDEYFKLHSRVMNILRKLTLNDILK